MKMRDLKWLAASGTGRPPESLLEMDVEELARRGVPQELLRTAKMLYCSSQGETGG
jgi:hypothetical protein